LIVSSREHTPRDQIDVSDIVLEALEELRRKIQARIRESNATTEREVMAAADAAGRVATVASEHIKDLQSVIARVQRQQGASFEQTTSADARLREIASHVDQQQASARQAIEQAGKIREVARSVQKLASRANILSLNARVEAARSGQGSEGFAVIANEMKQLSGAINAANVSIGALAEDLHRALPGLAQQATEIKQLSTKLSLEMTDGMRAIRDHASALSSQVASALAGSDAVMEQIVGASQDVLSHLQFQDTLAQGLGRMDGWLRETQVVAAEVLGVPERAAAFAPPMHSEIGGHKPIDQRGAGIVSLFDEPVPSAADVSSPAARNRAGEVVLFGED
jgi:methyl-accepting chemotaxis protein